MSLAQDTLRATGGFVEPSTSMEFVHRPGGCFEMGDLEVGVLERVCVDGFRIGRFEVTNRQYRQFRPDHDSGWFAGLSLNGDDQPVVSVSWHDAVTFAEWLSGQAGQVFRLPTEAEWEYAARAGSTAVRYWGADPGRAPEFANLRDRATATSPSDGFRVTAPVGSFAPNAAGLHDMLGNASEWVLDTFVPGIERYGDLDNPVVEGDGPLRVRRGGSWDDPARIVRSSSRDYYAADLAVPQTGFRLVIPADQVGRGG